MHEYPITEYEYQHTIGYCQAVRDKLRSMGDLYPYQQAVIDQIMAMPRHAVLEIPARMGMTTIRSRLTPNWASQRHKEPPKLAWPPRRSRMQQAMQQVFLTWSGK
jgi:hypothetical protein